MEEIVVQYLLYSNVENCFLVVLLCTKKMISVYRALHWRR